MRHFDPSTSFAYLLKRLQLPRNRISGPSIEQLSHKKLICLPIFILSDPPLSDAPLLTSQPYTACGQQESTRTKRDRPTWSTHLHPPLHALHNTAVMVQVFAVPIFFVVFRETLETSIVVSVLLAFIKQQLGPDQDKQLYKKLRKQVSSTVILHPNRALF